MNITMEYQDTSAQYKPSFK